MEPTPAPSTCLTCSLNTLERDDCNSWIGSIPERDVVAAVAHTAALRGLTAADMTVLNDDGWSDLFAATFGHSYGPTRLAVIQTLAA